MKYKSPAIEETDWHGDVLIVTVHDISRPPDYRRPATPEETHQAILYWIRDIHARIGEPKS